MSVISVRMGKSLYESIKDFSKYEGLSMNQSINSLLQDSLTRKEYSNMWGKPKKYSNKEVEDVLKHITDDGKK